MAPWSSDPLRDAGHRSPRVVRFANVGKGSEFGREVGSGRPLRDYPRSGILWSEKDRNQSR